MGITESVNQSARIIGSAVASIINWKDIEICPKCKSQLKNGNCPKGHHISR